MNRSSAKAKKPTQSIKWLAGAVVVALSLLLATYALGAFRIPIPATETDKAGNTYAGNLVYNEFFGPVKITLKDGSTWEGKLEKGLLDGTGTFTSDYGWVYVGEFDEGELLGNGSFELPDGTIVQEME